MARLTISLPAELHQALKEAAVRRKETIGELVAESLVAYGVKPEVTAVDLVRRARLHSALPEVRAVRLALTETGAVRSARFGTSRRASKRTQ